MRNLILIILFHLVSYSLLSQDSILIRQEKVKNTIQKIYLNSDSSFSKFIYNNKGQLLYIKKFADTNLSIEHGKWVEFFPNSSVKLLQYYNNGEPTGKWFYYSKNGNVLEEYNYDFTIKYFNPKDDKKLSQNLPNIPEVPIENVKDAKFNGGDINSFRDYLQQHLHIDRATFDKFDGSGKHNIKIKFTIDTNGNLIDLFISNNGEPILEKEVARVVRESPKWSPRIVNSFPEKQQIIMPAVFLFP
jgi:antitoxin component YwqK of YwqJK toxin-antitoxin module